MPTTVSENGWTPQELSAQLVRLERKLDRIVREHAQSEEAIRGAIAAVRQEIGTLPVKEK